MYSLPQIKHIHLIFGFALLFFTGIAASACAESEQQLQEPTIQSRLSTIFSYYLKDGGVWRQDNKDFKKGEGLPVAYIKKYSWGPGSTIVLDDTYALMEDGTCPQWTHNIAHWDRENSKIHVQIFHFSGLWAQGYVVKTGKQETSAEISGILADGSKLRMRDTTDLSRPDEAVVTALHWDGENWNKGDKASWKHVTSQERPCGF